MRSKTFTTVFTAFFLAVVAGGSMTLVLSGYQSYLNYSDPYSYVPNRPASSIAGMGMTPFANYSVIFMLDGARADTFYNTNKPTINGFLDWANWTDVQCSTLISASKIGYAMITTGCNSSESEVVSNDYVGLFRGDSLWNSTIRHSGVTAVVGGEWWYELFNPYLNYSIVFTSSMPGESTTAINVTNGGAPIQTAIPDYRDSLVSQYSQLIVQRYRPTFMVVHFSETDEAAHVNGSLSQSYVDALKNEDTYIGQVLAAYQAAGILDQTLVIVMSDHGHVDKGGHGGIEPEVLHIPLILRGPGVKPGEYGAHQHQNTVAPTISAVMGWEVPSDASGTLLFASLNLNATQEAIYRINLASIRLGQARITLEKMGYFSNCQADVNMASRHLDNANGNFTAANYAEAVSNAIISESISRAEIGSAWVSKASEEIIGRALLAIGSVAAIALISAFLIHRWRTRVKRALIGESDYVGVTVFSVAMYFLFFALATVLSGLNFSPSYFPDSVAAVIVSWFVPTVIALLPAGILFILFLHYLGGRVRSTDATALTYAALFLIITSAVYLSIITALIVVNSAGLPWYALDVVLSLSYFYIVVSGVAFAIFGLVSFLIGIALSRVLGFGRGRMQ